MPRPKALTPYLCLVAALTVGVLVLAFGVEVRMTGEAGVITTELPKAVGPWRGEAQLFCLGKGCGRKFLGEECENLVECPDCGSPVNSMSPSEYGMLPRDTILNRQAYHHPVADSVQAAIVLSGRDRASLHRPELCLTLPGREISRTHRLEVDVGEEDLLQVRVLDLLTTVKLPNGRTGQIGSYYAYWFSAKDRQTPNHLARMFWMAADKVLRSKIDRWAYISVSGARDLDSNDHLEAARDFIQEFYPLIQASEGGPAPAGPDQ